MSSRHISVINDTPKRPMKSGRFGRTIPTPSTRYGAILIEIRLFREEFSNFFFQFFKLFTSDTHIIHILFVISLKVAFGFWGLLKLCCLMQPQNSNFLLPKIRLFNMNSYRCLTNNTSW